MDFNSILSEIKKVVFQLFEEQYGTLKNTSKQEIECFLENATEKLKRWSKLLKNKELTKEEFIWLLKSQKDCIHLKALQQVGVSKISIGLFKNKVLNTVASLIINRIL